ncbi:hypothetical protein SIM91_04065 [Rhodococcus opacus]|uniref:hypothetical protein n=1 Tax=Rhodococcus opacus TaxID=37919 RepID=UPI000AF113A3|nr:hypothetical protein [Rhodococcus opacus]MDX5962515.1 hypothetical protein [Rhodococcus opacus]
MAWYQRLFGMDRVPVTFPHLDRENTGYAVLLVDPRSGAAIGLHTNEANQGEPFDEARTGLDHVPGRSRRHQRHLRRSPA